MVFNSRIKIIHRTTLLRSDARKSLGNGVATAAAFPSGEYAGVLQYQTAMQRFGDAIASRWFCGVGAVRRFGAARTRSSIGAICEQKLLGAGGY